MMSSDSVQNLAFSYASLDHWDVSVSASEPAAWLSSGHELLQSYSSHLTPGFSTVQDCCSIGKFPMDLPATNHQQASPR